MLDRMNRGRQCSYKNQSFAHRFLVFLAQDDQLCNMYRSYMKKAAAAAPPATIAPAILLTEAAPINCAAVTLLLNAPVLLAEYPPVMVGEPAVVGKLLVIE